MEGEGADDVGSVVLVVEVGADSELVDVIEDVVDSGVVVDSLSLIHI